MVNTSKKKRTFQKYYDFFMACFWSLLGLVVYLLGIYLIPFPSLFFSKDSSETQKHLFSYGISIHSSVSFFLGILFHLLSVANKKKIDYLKVRKWKHWTNKLLVLFLSIVLPLLRYYSNLENGWINIILFCLTNAIVNFCLIDLIIQLMNQYGICNAFNLIFFTSYLPTDWSKSWSFQNLLFLFLITVLFIWITNIKWEAPIETNRLYYPDNKLVENSNSCFGFKLNFSFMPLFHLSWLLSFIHSVKRAWQNQRTFNPNFIKEIIIGGEAGGELSEGNETFWETFFIINKKEKIFCLKEEDSRLRKKYFFGAILLLLFLRGLAVWHQVSQMTWNTREISQDLQKNGIYFDGVPPGRPTQKLLKKIVNRLIISWLIIILIFNFIFDNFNFVIDNNLPSFVNWFSGVNIGIDLVQQIRIKYKYIQVNK